MHFLATRTKSLKIYFFTSGVVKNVFLCICAYFQTTRIKSLKNYFFSPLEWLKTCFDAFPDHQKQVLQKLFFNVWRVPWHSLYKHSLYVTKFIRTFFIRDRVYTGQSLYRTKFIQGQSLYEDKVYTGTKFIRDKVHTVTNFIRGQSLYKLFSYCILKLNERLIAKC